MGIVPLVLGMPWIMLIKPEHKYSFAYSSGFFMALVLFQIVSIPVALLHGSFIAVAIVYSIALMLACVFSICYTKKNRLLTKKKISRLRWTEWIYVLGFAAILGIQIIRGFSYDITYMSYDDAGYSVKASDALAGNGIYNIDSYTGIKGVLDIKYVLASWNIYPAYFALISGVAVTTVSHTIQYIQLIILAYLTYWYVAGELLKTRENQIIFLLIIALFYWFGYHSHYSLSFRLLGPNYQGKAVLAVSLTPLILTIIQKITEEKYSKATGVFFLLLSLSGLSLTLWATGTIIVITVIPLVLSVFRKKRNYKHLLYILWSCAIPIAGGCFFLLYKYAI